MRQQIAPTIFGDGQQTRDFVYVSDIAQANLLATQSAKAAGQTINIGRGQPINLNQLAQTLGQLLNFAPPPTYQPARPGDIQHSYANPMLAQQLLNWSPQTPFEIGLQKTVSFQI
jgi:UDP-glucose 4-epimerase